MQKEMALHVGRQARSACCCHVDEPLANNRKTAPGKEDLEALLAGAESERVALGAG